MHYWRVKTNEERLYWTLTPNTGVGPLAFKMTPEEVHETLAEHSPPSTATSRQSGSSTCLRKYDEFIDLGLRVYYTDERLTIVAVDARTGPQIVLDGIHLTGRVPSKLEHELADHPNLHYTHEGNPALPDSCLAIRVQRTGDAVFTRPVIALPELAGNIWDGFPQDELHLFA